MTLRMHSGRSAASPSVMARTGSRAVFTFAVASSLVVSGLSAGHAATTNPNPGSLELQNAQLSRSAAAQGMVLLENHEAALPIAKNANVALFGVGAYGTPKGGTGSGAVNNRYSINVRTGLENAGYKITTSPDYWNAMVCLRRQVPARRRRRHPRAATRTSPRSSSCSRRPPYSRPRRPTPPSTSCPASRVKVQTGPPAPVTTS